MRKLSLLVVVLAATAACRGSGSGDDTVTPDSPGGGNDTKIQDIQNDAMPEGTAVTIKGVIVTAIDNYGGKMGDFWIEEPGGGAYSGVHVYGAPLDQVAALAVGDVVDLTGAAKTEFALTTDTSGNKLTELEPVSGGTMTVTKVMSGTPITPDVVDALAIGQMADFHARDAEWEKWEGVLITVNNVSAFSTASCVGSACSDVTLQSFDITGDALVESGLAAMPMPAVKNGDCLTGVTGVLDYFFNYQILPRTTAEIGLNGSSCPHENQSATCADSLDNDGNGFTDCLDNQCVVASATCRMDETASIPNIQAATAPDIVGANVRIASAVVTAIAFNGKDVWISTNAAATTNNGIQVHFNDKVPSSVAVGKTVEVIGKIAEFNDSMNMGTQTVTEITGYSITASGSAVATTGVAAASATTMDSDTTGEPYESVLVTMTNVKLKTLADSMNHIGTMTQGGHDFKFDDAIYRIGEAGCTGTGCGTVRPVNTCWATITGIWTYNAFDNNWVFYPRVGASATVEDGVATGGTCP